MDSVDTLMAPVNSSNTINEMDGQALNSLPSMPPSVLGSNHIDSSNAPTSDTNGSHQMYREEIHEGGFTTVQQRAQVHSTPCLSVCLSFNLSRTNTQPHTHSNRNRKE